MSPSEHRAQSAKEIARQDLGWTSGQSGESSQHLQRARSILRGSTWEETVVGTVGARCHGHRSWGGGDQESQLSLHSSSGNKHFLRACQVQSSALHAEDEEDNGSAGSRH